MTDPRQDPPTPTDDDPPREDSPPPAEEPSLDQAPGENAAPREPLPESRKRGTLTGPPPARGGRPGRATRRIDPDRPCMNCGDPSPGEYCPTCGQRKVDVQVSVRVMMMDVLEDQFILDRRLPRTLKLLLFRPGRLTVEYVNGRMASYIHPFRLYLVTSVVFFLLLSFLSLQLVRRATINAEDDPAAAEATTPAADSAELVELREQLAELDEELENPDMPAAGAAGIQLGRAAVMDQIESIEARLAAAEAAAQDTTAAVSPAPGDTAADTTAATAPEAPEPPDEPEDDEDPATVAEMFDWDEREPEIKVMGWPAAEQAVRSRLRQIGRMQPSQALEELVDTFLNYVPTLMFVLLPIFAVVLKLLYIRRRRFYAEHFVFLLHVHSFVFILATLMLLVREYVPWWVELAAIMWILVYIYIALRRVYGQGWFKTFVKYWVLGWMYFWILAASLPVAILGTLMLF